MARFEQEREDLIRDAVALIRRAEIVVPDVGVPVVAGFRARGELSLYFGDDPCLHFDASGGLRRAFIDGKLYRTQGDTLACLDRKRTSQEVTLERTDLSPEESNLLRKRLLKSLRELLAALSCGKAELGRHIPQIDDLRADLADRLTAIIAGEIRLAQAVPTRRN